MVKKWTYDEAYELLKPYKSDFFTSIMLAQFNLESVMGTSELAVKVNNFTGHKTTGWNGKVYKKDTIEDDGKGNKVVAKSEPFRHYASPSEWAKHHASWLQRLPDTYAKAINAKTVEEQAQALQGTYATDTSYAKKLLDIIERDNLKKYDTKKETGKMAYIGIDIGHGKNSPARGGSKGWTGDEHSFNSKVAVRTKALLEAMGHKGTLGVQNPNSNEVGLSPRTNYFNAQKVDVLVSIHANAHSNTTVNGISAFYDRYGRGRDSASLKLAQAIMKEYRKQGQVIWSTGEVPSYRGNWTDFHMNRESTMPSVLMELGFMTGNRDREYVFGSKQAQFVEDMAQGIAAGVDKYFGGAGKTESTYNPQGLDTQPIPAYTPPNLPFDELKKGQEVTVRDPFNWVNLATKEFMKSKKHNEIVGTKDRIKEVRVLDEPMSYSKRVYLLEKYNSWILEQDIIEARASWEKVEDKPEDEGLKEGQFVLDGEKYQVGIVK